jgi:hypothetical protein
MDFVETDHDTECVRLLPSSEPPSQFSKPRLHETYQAEFLSYSLQKWNIKTGNKGFGFRNCDKCTGSLFA